MAAQQSHLLRAAWVAPMDRPPLPDGAVLVAGDGVVAVGPAADLLATHGGADVYDYEQAVLLPGLVNAHTHLELSHLSPPPGASASTFTQWLLNVMRPSGAPVAESVRAGIERSLCFGVTAVGDVSRDVGAARPPLAASRIMAVGFGEVVGMAGRRYLLGPRLAAAIEAASGSGRLFTGISPHAPYSVDGDGYRRCLDAARRNRLPLTTHLAESADEARFLSDHAGPFRELWEKIGAWDNSVPRFEGGPVRFAQSLGLLDYPLASLAHVNYCDDGELDLLAAGKASVVYCPRTHAYFGHPPHRWRDMLARGVNVAVGTDSCASSPDLNLVDDVRLLHRLAPDVPPAALWEMATVRAALALGIDAVAGTLAVGKAADVAVFPADSEDPLREVLERPVLPLAVWAGGVEVVTGARPRPPRE